MAGPHSFFYSRAVARVRSCPPLQVQPHHAGTVPVLSRSRSRSRSFTGTTTVIAVHAHFDLCPPLGGQRHVRPQTFPEERTGLGNVMLQQHNGTQ